ncbi:hypothetical protein P7L53_01215 [Thermoleptolyngbya sichuanensis XZ-Cy5]|uniref:hypothetical protein n=1 Tax=Thermoleptolyngbya sichuanensis TaxID=2885951 RepID=UPI00240E6A95|nr:hypothetical protein [Thermoleptolyngbya sichuanensis]MDG2614853.1 hypothetical protein [Thermoleptolyngbya sichuanensis XZ-Cy5]
MTIPPQQVHPTWPQGMTPASRIRAIALAAAIGVFGAIGATVGVRPAIACEYGAWVEPSRETRRYENTQLGVAFQIPANYRAMGRQGGQASIMNPTNYDYIQCITRAGYGEGGWFSSLELNLDTVPAGSRGLEQAIRANHTWLDSQIRLVNQGSKELAVYIYTDQHDEIEVANIAFFTPDRRRIVTISGPQDDPVFQRAIATLELR